MRLLKQHFCVIRSAASGKSGSPDIIAFNKGLVYAFEVKHTKNGPSLPMKQYLQLKQWAERAGVTVMVAWKNKQWYFLPLEVLRRTKTRAHLKAEDAQRLGLGLEQLL